MFMNMLIIGEWIITIGLFGVGFYVKERMEEKKRKKKGEPWRY